ERRAQPVRLALDEAGEEGRAAGGSLDERPRRAGQVAEAGGDLRHPVRVVRARRAADALGEGPGHGRLAALVARRALLDEGRDALAEVAGAARLALQRRLERELLAEAVAEALAQRLLDEPIGDRRPAGELAGARRHGR